MEISLGFSPCPNDTFIFDALVNKKIDTEGLDFSVHLEDVQTLNDWAISGKLDVSKISYGVLPLLLDKYKLLSSGGALGKGVGPLLIAGKEIDDLKSAIASMQVAIPGKNTTAHLLFSMAFPQATNKTFLVFNKVEDAVLSGQVDAGVIIHENRFTYQDKGLVKLIDLGNYWEEQTNAPIPLGGIVIRKTMEAELGKRVDSLIKKSVAYAFKNYPAITDYVRLQAQEMNEDVMRKHIDLYVNEYSTDLGESGRKAVQQLMNLYAQRNHLPVIVDQDYLV